mmetsp:Transcript_49847/g.139513  ORF Transcript_49847/g.139513 Transcript_49847/m.139513 type:complete len:237 (+) Transcript_49847:930-1640(+)
MLHEVRVLALASAVLWLAGRSARKDKTSPAFHVWEVKQHCDIAGVQGLASGGVHEVVYASAPGLRVPAHLRQRVRSLRLVQRPREAIAVKSIGRRRSTPPRLERELFGSVCACVLERDTSFFPARWGRCSALNTCEQPVIYVQAVVLETLGVFAHGQCRMGHPDLTVDLKLELIGPRLQVWKRLLECKPPRTCLGAQVASKRHRPRRLREGAERFHAQDAFISKQVRRQHEERPAP